MCAYIDGCWCVMRAVAMAVVVGAGFFLLDRMNEEKTF